MPHLALRLAGANVRHARPLAVAGMPYGWVAQELPAGPVYRLGDQAAVIPSFTGDGMAMALRSARQGAEAILGRRPASEFQRELAHRFRGPVRLAGLVASLTAATAAQRLLVAAASAAPWLLAGIAAGTRIGPPLRR